MARARAACADMDMMRWCLGQDVPRAVTAMGGKYAMKDNREIPDTLAVLWHFDGPTLVTFSVPGPVQAGLNLIRAFAIVASRIRREGTGFFL
jgi:hypothetical protein